jgi:hypothetical protein
MTGDVARGIWEFVVGEDWRTAAGVAVVLALTALVASTGLPAWWLSPLATLAILHRSLRGNWPRSSQAGPSSRL